MIDWLSDLRPKKKHRKSFSTSSPKMLRNYSSWSGIVSQQLCWLALSYKSSSHGLNGGSENSERMTGPGLGGLAGPYRILSHPNGWFFQPDFFFTFWNPKDTFTILKSPFWNFDPKDTFTILKAPWPCCWWPGGWKKTHQTSPFAIPDKTPRRKPATGP